MHTGSYWNKKVWLCWNSFRRSQILRMLFPICLVKNLSRLSRQIAVFCSALAYPAGVPFHIIINPESFASILFGNGQTFGKKYINPFTAAPLGHSMMFAPHEGSCQNTRQTLHRTFRNVTTRTLMCGTVLRFGQVITRTLMFGKLRRLR